MNIFSYLDNSDNEEEQPAQVAPKKGKDGKDAAPAKATTAVSAKPVTVPGAKKETTPKSTTDKPKGKDAPAANGKAADNKSAKPAKDTKPVTPATGAAEEEGAKDNNRGGLARGKDHVRRGDKHGPNANTEDNGRYKREFERRSATGRGREVSKGGRGKFGAGNVSQDALEAEKDPNVAEGDVEVVADVAEVEPEPEAEPEPVTFTLDEFMAKRKEAHERAATLVESKARKVDANFNGMQSKVDDVSDLLPGKGTKAAVATHKDQRSTGKNQILDVAFSFESTANDRGDRGYSRDSREGGRGRGGGRGGRGRDGGRGERTGGRHTPKGPSTVFNSGDFPSL